MDSVYSFTVALDNVTNTEKDFYIDIQLLVYVPHVIALGVLKKTDNN
jgi:hypothetical protein